MMALSQYYRVGFITVSITLIIAVCLYASFYVRGYLVENQPENHSTAENVKIVQQEIGKRSIEFKPLPKDVIDGVKTFVFFLGHAHSGHSIVGSLMDAHPHMVIAHEANVFRRLGEGNLKPNKATLFNIIWRKTVQGSVHGKRVTSVKGYSLLVEGLYEGKYVDHIEVIGDKKAGLTTSFLLRHPKKFSSTLEIVKSLASSVKVVHVIRNPYDNIATSVIYVNNTKAEVASIKESKETYRTSSSSIFHQIRVYFSAYKAIEDAKKSYKLDYIEVHGRDLVSDARGTISRMCNGLGVFCSSNYLDVCSDKVFKTESKTRYKINWDKAHLDLIQRNIDRFSSLNGYTFDS